MKEQAARPMRRGGPRALTRVALHAQAAEQLRRMVLRGEIAAGERINEAALASGLGVSRTPLREAVMLLVSEGLLELLPGRGARVRGFSANEILDHFEIIGALERHAAEIVAERMNPQLNARLRRLHETLKGHFAERNQKAYFLANQRFHAFIVEAAESPVLSAIHQELSNKARHERPAALFSEARWVASLQEHEALLKAILAGDRVKAGDLTLQHARRTGHAVMEQLGVAPPKIFDEEAGFAPAGSEKSAKAG